jgi:membrane fusion protein (multidrug efflux system)
VSRFRLAECHVVLAVALTSMVSACGGTPVSTEEQVSTAPTPVLAVSAVPVATAPLRSTIDLLGTTTALRHITLRAPSSGRLIGFDLRSGDQVRQGQIVGRIINQELEAARNGLAVAQQIDPQEAAALKSSVDRYAYGPGVPVKATATAVVSQPLVSSGQTVAYLDPLADLIDPTSIYVEAQVPVDDASLIRPGMPAVVTSPVRPGVKFPARVMALSPTFNKGGETAPARLDFTGPERISIAGAPVTVHIVTEFVPNAVTVPSSALFQNARNDSWYLYTIGADGLAHRVAVKVGIRDDGRAQIIKGVTPGQLVITSGGYALSDGLRVKLLNQPMEEQ